MNLGDVDVHPYRRLGMSVDDAEMIGRMTTQMKELKDQRLMEIGSGSFPAPPVAHLLGSRIISISPAADNLLAEYEARDAFLNPAGTVQGGILSAMLDDAMATLVMAGLARSEHCATVNMNIAFLSPARPGALTCRATLTKRGETICHVSGELRQDGRLICNGASTCVIVQSLAPLDA